MDRDRRLAEMMGMCWHEWERVKVPAVHPFGCGFEVRCKKCGVEHFSNRIYPDFTTPEWRARLMDWAVEQEWWNGFVEKQKSIFLGKWVRGEIDGKPWVNPESEFITYLWRNLATLIVEYHREGRE